MTVVPSAKPAGWVPPYPVWSGRFDGQTKPMVFGYIGCQYAEEGAPAAEFRRWWALASQATDGPIHFEWASYRDVGDRLNLVVLCYWLDVATYERWWVSPLVESWWTDAAREQDDAGYWREMNVVAPDKFETVFSSHNPMGVTVAADGFTDEIEEHAYWGSMRERIPASAYDGLIGSLAAVKPAAAGQTAARRRVQLTHNLAMIRSGQDWRACRDEERDYYLRKVHPVMMKGLLYLRDNSEETGCLSSRFMASLQGGCDDQVTFGSALFRELGDLEAWAKKHPTHLAIFGAFHTMVRKFDGALDLRLWHEVVIIDGPASTYEYVNCAPETGALRWLEPA